MIENIKREFVSYGNESTYRDDKKLIFEYLCHLKYTVNELIDAVNKLDALLDLTNTAIQTLKQPDLPDGDDAIQEVIHADPYAEQRKLICKLCWFWNNDKADKVIGILTGVLDEADRPFERNIDQTLYKHCEPVKPDDDIIYRGE